MKVLYISSTMSGIHTKGIYSDLMNHLNAQGHEVYVLYAREQRMHLDTECYQKENINYLGVKTGNITKNKNLIQKGISTLMLDHHFIKAYQKHWSDINFDLVLMSTPPITMIKTLQFIKKNNPNVFCYLMLKDIFPQNAVDLNLMTFKPLINYFERKEKSLYQLFDYIGVMSEKNKEYIINHHPDVRDKVEIFPNTLAPIVPELNINRSAFDLPEDKVCLFYGGNLGKPQGIDFLLQTLEQIRNREDLYFVIAGSGSEDYRIKEYLAKNKPTNVKFMGYLDNDVYHQLVSVMDIGLIYLDYRFTIPNYPQRILGYLECAIPVICATDDCTDIGLDAENHGYGFKVSSNDSDQWLEKVELLVSDATLRKNMGEKGYQYFLDNFTVDRSYKIIMSHFDGRK